MALTQKDLDAIKDIVDFSISNSEHRLEVKIEEVKKELKEYTDKQTDDLAAINRAVFAKIDDHETRICSLEATRT